MNIRPSAAGLPKTDDKLFTAIAATGDDGLSSFLAPDSAESFAALTIAKLTAAQSDDTAAAARLEAQAAQVEADIKSLADRKRKQRGRRRADAILGALRAMEDAGLDPHQIDGFHADCIWSVADLLHAIAGEPDRLPQQRPEAELAKGSAPAVRVLDKGVEDGIAASGTSA